jgi:exodeoxyribonuclease V alpha subunit
MPVKAQPPPKQYAESLSSLIERVTFWNEDTGFVVLKAKVKGHRDLVTVVGSRPAVSASRDGEPRGCELGRRTPAAS